MFHPLQVVDRGRETELKNPVLYYYFLFLGKLASPFVEVCVLCPLVFLFLCQAYLFDEVSVADIMGSCIHCPAGGGDNRGCYLSECHQGNL